MRTSLLICATCLLVTGCSAQFRLPSLSSALSSLTGYGANSASGSNSNGAQSGQASSPYSGLVRDYGRNLMMAMSSIYPTLFKPPQQQQAQPQQQSQPAQSPFEQFGASQSIPSQSLFSSGQSGPSFSFGGSTFSISPSFPFGSLGGGGSQQAQASGPAPGVGPAPAGGSHSPFSASFGSSINSPPSFGPLSSSPFLSQSMPSFAPASSYNAAFEAANGASQGLGNSNGAASAAAPSMGSPMFASLGQGPSSLSSNGINSAQSLLSQSAQSNPMNSYSQLPSFGGQHDSSSQLMSQPSHHQAQSVGQASSAHQANSAFNPVGAPQQNQPSLSQQYSSSSQFRPDMMSIAASAPVPSSSSYSSYGNMPSQQGQGPASPSSYQQPSYR